MHGLLGALLLASVAWLLVGLPLLVDGAGSNYRSHAHERILLWTRYDIFSDIDGADSKNAIICKQDKDAKHWKDRNIGSGEKGKYTYGEFQASIEGKNWPNLLLPEDKAKWENLKAPRSNPDGETPSIEECVQALNNNKANMPLAVKEVNKDYLNSLFEVGGDEYDPEDPDKTAYTHLVAEVEKKFHEMRKSSGDAGRAAKLERVNKLGTEVLRRITVLRREEKQQYLSDLMTKTVNDGLRIPRNMMVGTRNKQSEVPGGKTFYDVNIAATIQNAWGDPQTRATLEQAGYGNANQLVEWADGLGDPSARNPAAYTHTQRTHIRAAKAWMDALAKAKMSVEELNKC